MNKSTEDIHKKEFELYFDKVMSFIKNNYKDCDISVPKYNFLTIEKQRGLDINNIPFKFKVTLDNTILLPTFDVIINYGYKIYAYHLTGLNYADFKIFMAQTVYQWYKNKNSSTKTNQQNWYKNSSTKGNQQNWYKNSSTKGNQQNYSSQQKPYQKPYEKPESDDIKNKRRRYNLLKTTLDGFKRELDRIREWERINGKKHSDKEQTINQILNVKDRINDMNKLYHFESVYYLKHLKPILS